MCGCICGKQKTCMDKEYCEKYRSQEKYMSERENGRPILKTSGSYRKTEKPYFSKVNNNTLKIDS